MGAEQTRPVASSRTTRQALRSPFMTPAPPPIRVNRAPVLTLWATGAAERLVEYLERAGYVVMCKPSLAPHSVNLGAEINKAAKIRREE
jgi:hypothetical protein